MRLIPDPEPWSRGERRRAERRVEAGDVSWSYWELSMRRALLRSPRLGAYRRSLVAHDLATWERQSDAARQTITTGIVYV